MRHHYPNVVTEYQILKAVRLFRWVTRNLLALYFFGSVKRSKALEELLPKLEREGKVGVVWHEGQKVYFRKRKNGARPVSLEHEIRCTEVLIRLWRCRMAVSEIVPERIFRGHNVVSDGGIRYEDARGTMVTTEYHTRRSLEKHNGEVKGKITRYRNSLYDLEIKLNREITVLFILDMNRERVKDLIKSLKPILEEPVVSGVTGKERYPFFFTDYETFKRIPVGRALKAPIYFWHDGKEYQLSHD